MKTLTNYIETETERKQAALQSAAHLIASTLLDSVNVPNVSSVSVKISRNGDVYATANLRVSRFFSSRAAPAERSDDVPEQHDADRVRFPL